MPRVLALDWDAADVRCVLASVTGRSVQILATASAALAEAGESERASTARVSNALQAALAGQSIRRATTIVGVHRASVEMFNFTFPPATDQELALLVHNQLVRELPGLTDEDAIDFVPASVNPGESRAVTAAVLEADRRQALERTCKAAGLRPQRLVLRPLAAAAHFLRTSPPPERSCLVVNALADEVDLIVLSDGQTVLLRTVRLPREEEENLQLAAQHLVAEINRTLLVLQQSATGRMPERIYLFGGEREHPLLRAGLETDLTIPVAVVDPFAGVDVAGVEVPANPGRFAALLGMVGDEAHGTHALDFLHPKRTPRPAPRRRVLLLAAGLLGLVALAAGYMYWDTLAELQQRNAELVQQRKKLDEALKAGRARTQLAEAVAAWKDAEIVWLDELRELSLQLPPSRDLLIHRMTIASGRSGGGGVIDLQGVARTAAVVAQIDRELHGPYRTVGSRRVGDRPQDRDYSWVFERTISVIPREKSLYRTEPGAAP